eukprot:COSAG06_NODE_13763_length_1221_cov_160.367201_1_plen_161_part_00
MRLVFGPSVSWQRIAILHFDLFGEKEQTVINCTLPLRRPFCPGIPGADRAHCSSVCAYIYIWCIHTWHTQQKRKSMDRIQVALAPRMDLIWLSRACLGKLSVYGASTRNKTENQLRHKESKRIECNEVMIKENCIIWYNNVIYIYTMINDHFYVNITCTG